MSLFEKLPDQAPKEMTKSAFAGSIGVSPGRVSQMITNGLPVLDSGRIPVETATAWYRANIRQKIDGAGKATQDLSAVKLENEQAKRDLLLIDIARKKRELVDRKEVELALYDRARGERDAHIAWVSRVAPILAGELGVDLSFLFAAMDREMRQHLQELSETPLSELLNDE